MSTSPRKDFYRQQLYRLSCIDEFLTVSLYEPNEFISWRFEMYCTRLAENKGRKQSPKIRHLRTIAQLCRAVSLSLQLRHVSTIGKKLVKQQYLLQMSPQYGELRQTSGWDRSGSLGHPRIGSVTARHSGSGRQPNSAALNRGRHLCSAGRPSRWALAHILVKLRNAWPNRLP